MYTYFFPVTTVGEAVQWLSYSYLYVRMRKNPLVYGMKYQDVKGRIFYAILSKFLFLHVGVYEKKFLWIRAGLLLKKQAFEL